MRIACVHIPQFALQAVTRVDPALRGAAIVVVGPLTRGPVVLAYSRAAFALGARIGMSATAARTLSPDLELVTADAQLERDTTRAIADVLLSLSPVVDIGGRVGPSGAHRAIYCEVPAKTRGTSFGDRLIERLAALGLTARVGIADDRFTAWVAASSPTDTTDPDSIDSVVSVPRGGSAAFLAPRPLSLLAITPEVQHMLEALGVHTVGQFAALPAPTVSSRFEADYQALARGESGNVLRPYTPDAPIREEATIRSHVSPHASSHDTIATTSAASTSTSTATSSPPSLSLPAAVALLAERVAMRLAGRARCAARFDITIAGESGEHVVPIVPVRDGLGVLSSAEDIADAIGRAVGDASTTVWRLRVVVTGEALAGDTTGADAGAITSPTQGAFAAVASTSAASSSASSVSASSFNASSSAATSSGASSSGASSSGASSSGASSAPASQPTRGADVDTLSLVLSSTGGGVFGLTSPVSNAREQHRRTRRGKQRRRSTPAIGTTVQPRLFKL